MPSGFWGAPAELRVRRKGGGVIKTLTLGFTVVACPWCGRGRPVPVCHGEETPQRACVEGSGRPALEPGRAHLRPPPRPHRAPGAVSASEVTSTPDADGGPGGFPLISREPRRGACPSCLSGVACPVSGDSGRAPGPAATSASTKHHVTLRRHISSCGRNASPACRSCDFLNAAGRWQLTSLTPGPTRWAARAFPLGTPLGCNSQAKVSSKLQTNSMLKKCCSVQSETLVQRSPGTRPHVVVAGPAMASGATAHRTLSSASLQLNPRRARRIRC